MVYDSSKHNRQSSRFKNFDYSQDGYYFVTIMCKNREHLFGKIVNSEMIYNDAGRNAKKCWEEIPIHFPDVILHEYIVMPNHVHGIIQIKKNYISGVFNNVVVDDIIGVDNIVGAENFQTLQTSTQTNQPPTNQFQKIIPRSLGSIVRGFKIGVTKWYKINENFDVIWQRNYYETIIFDLATYARMEDYIRNNPKNFKQ